MRLYPEQIRAIQRTQQAPPLKAKAALLVDADTGQTLYSLRSRDRLPPASTSKMMTALVVIDRAALDERVTVSARAAATEGSRMGLRAGETLTVGDLLHGLLLPSGNDAAAALAEHVGGSEAEFVRLMNAAAATLELTETRFTDPHGMDDATQWSSAADLMKIARAAMARPAFAAIVAKASATVAGHQLTNTNQLLGTNPQVDGVKTGTTDAAGECLVASLNQRGHRLFLVLLGSSDRYDDAKRAFDFAAATWEWRSLALPNDALSWQHGPDGVNYRLQAAAQKDLFLPNWQWRLAQPVRILDPTAPLTGTQPIGRLDYTLAGQLLAASR